jgi:hypothetical protein
MNRSDAYGEKVAGGYHGRFRPCWKAGYETVQSHGHPQIFLTEAEAESAAWRTLRDMEEPVMVRSGPMINAARAKAEAVFRRERA